MQYQTYHDPVIITQGWNEYQVWVKAHPAHRNHSLMIALFYDLDEAEAYVKQLKARI